MSLCKKVTIFEGPDGSGKTTAATEYAKRTGARLIHCGPLPRLTAKGLGRYYLEAMAPALDGYQDVVLDRCWASEPVYGKVFRGGKDRLGAAGRRLLERVALRCDARLVLCLPPEETCLGHWRKRRAAGLEYLDKENQLSHVWREYAARYASGELTQLHTYVYDYSVPSAETPFERVCHESCHTVEAPTSGMASADKVLLVGEECSDPTDWDWLRQYPFCGLGPGGCSRWLAQRLQNAGVSERDLLWTNAKVPGARVVVESFKPGVVVALGEVAEKLLTDWGLPPDHVVPHPQWWKRFKSGVHVTDTYPLVKLLKEVLR